MFHGYRFKILKLTQENTKLKARVNELEKEVFVGSDYIKELKGVIKKLYEEREA